MSKFLAVTGQLVEVRRYINVPMRWCEQYPARERWELWVVRPGGAEVKLVVHSRAMPARRGHPVTVLMRDSAQVAGLLNDATGESINFISAEPPLLLRRCDGAVVLGLLAVAAGAAWFLGAGAFVLGVAVALLSLPVVGVARLAHRAWLCLQVDRALARIRRWGVAQAPLRLVK